MSLSRFISRGYFGIFSRASYGELGIEEESIEYLHDGIGPIADVIPPYKPHYVPSFLS
jgi:hypothetical protein